MRGWYQFCLTPSCSSKALKTTTRVAFRTNNDASAPNISGGLRSSKASACEDAYGFLLVSFLIKRSSPPTDLSICSLRHTRLESHTLRRGSPSSKPLPMFVAQHVSPFSSSGQPTPCSRPSHLLIRIPNVRHSAAAAVNTILNISYPEPNSISSSVGRHEMISAPCGSAISASRPRISSWQNAVSNSKITTLGTC